MGSRYERDQDLNQRISRTVLTDPAGTERYRTDVAAHLQIEVLRGVLLLADKAMEAEGIRYEVRNRVVHWVLVGEPAPRWEKDPDAELDQAVQQKLAERNAWIRHLNEMPINVPPLLEG